MYALYSFVYTLGFLAMLPVFLVRKDKYLTGFRQRFGRVPRFRKDGRPVIWIHCVSVGETNAARPLVARLRQLHPSYRIVVSTVTRTGQELARDIFADSADFIFYFPFDWRFTVRRTLRAIRPNIVLVLETEIWFNFFREAHRRGITLAIVNGRVSEKSVDNYLRIPKTIKRVMRSVDFVFAQSNQDAGRFKSLGVRGKKIRVTGNIKYDQEKGTDDGSKTAYFRERFSVLKDQPLIVAASTHEPEEKWIIEAFRKLKEERGLGSARLIIAPRHPERFEAVAETIGRSGLAWARRSGNLSLADGEAEVILLDSIGELRSVYPLASLVFVGGSLMPHGGQNILEPALERKAIVTGPYMSNFASIVRQFEDADAFIKLPETSKERWPVLIESTFRELLKNDDRREELGQQAYKTASRNRGATERTVEALEPVLLVHSPSERTPEVAVTG